MPRTRQPRSGTMQFWPRVRAKRQYAKVRSWADSKDAKVLGFTGYKAGMTQVQVVDNRATSPTKGQNIVLPVTVVECPPNFVVGITSYNNTQYGLKKISTVFCEKPPKELGRKLTLAKKKSKAEIKEADDVRLLVMTQPGKTGIGKKKPEIFEVGIGGPASGKLEKAKALLGKELPVNDVFAEGDLVDAHVITTGKGFQGPTKRMGTSLRNHKSEKGVRGPANLGSWQGNRQWTVAQAGQMGYQQRTEYNKQIYKISDKPDEVNPKGGFVRFGEVKNQFILVKGTIAGPRKRIIRLCAATRPGRKHPKEAPRITLISKESKQGNR